MADGPELILEGTLVDLLGLEGYEFDGEEIATARMPVHDGVRQPFGIVHGGAYAALAESIVSRATFEGTDDGMAAIGQANESIFLRPIRSGTVNARARVLHRGRTSWVWDVEMTDDEGRLCATSRMIIAVRPMPSR
jgi:1,4-dihydroxy-2-naphthoyl-CoA hydrolase